jgi:hypothetical protein
MLMLNRRILLNLSGERGQASRHWIGWWVVATGQWQARRRLLVEHLSAQDPPPNPISKRRRSGSSVWPPLQRISEWLRHAGWPTLARRLQTAPLAEQIAVAWNPYRLISKRRGDLTFSVADHLAVNLLGLSRDSLARLHAAIEESVRVAYRDSYSSLHIAALCRQLTEQLGIAIAPEALSSLPAQIAVRHGEYLYAPDLDRLRRQALSMLEANQRDLFAEEGDAVVAMLQNRYAVLTGPAGSGKTTAIKRLAESLRTDGLTVQLTAMTGKAASVLGGDACTLHRLLAYQHGHCGVRDLPSDVIVVDEASMLTWTLLHALLAAARGKILFCGDAAQLPPVTGDPVFPELLRRLPVHRLETAHRFLAGTRPHHAKLPVTTVQHKSAQHLLENTMNLATAHWAAGSVQVLTPINFSPLGTVRLNQMLQQKLNPHGQSIGRFRVGDRVIVTRNCYEIATPVYNGQVGYVMGGSGPEAVVVRLEHGLTVTLAEADLDLAYCLTVHKAQGSQYDVVVLVLPKSRLGGFVDQHLEHVGCTRARRRTYCLVL